MSDNQPKPRGFVVDHKESKVRYAVSAHNFNEKIHDKVRPLKQHETVRGFTPKATATQGTKEAPEDDARTATKDTQAHAATPAPRK